MKLFVIALKSSACKVFPQHARDTIECARRYSGVDCIGISDFNEPGWIDATPYLEPLMATRNFSAVKPELDWMGHSLWRWFIMGEYVRRHNIAEPIFNCDWDMMIFQPLEPFLKSIGAFDADFGICVAKDVNIGSKSAPYFVTNLDAIHYFCAIYSAQLHWWPEAMNKHCYSDMAWWSAIDPISHYRYCDLSVEKDGQWFDMNIIIDGDRFEKLPNNCKRIEWKDGRPCFVKLVTGELIKAVVIHCFMGMKERTGDLLSKAT